MFRGLGSVNFTYGGGVATGSNGWSFSIRSRFDSQLASQPQYKGILDGWKYVANMAIGLADDDYRSKYGVIPGTNLSEFGQWIDGNRQAVYNEAQGWFTYVPPTTTQPPTTTTPPPSGGTPTYPFPLPPVNGSGGGFELPGGMTLWIIGGLALFFLMKR